MDDPLVPKRKKPGPPKGFRYGGRGKGTPNKASLKRGEQAIQQMERAQAAREGGKKMAIEQIEDFGVLFASIAARYQPKADPADTARLIWDPLSEERFHKYGTLALTAFKELANYQSPKLRAHQVIPPAPPSRGSKETRVSFSMFDRVLDVTPNRKRKVV